MSYTEIYKFKKNGNAELLSEIKNSWRGAMAIWDILDKKYLPKFVPDWAKLLGTTDQEYYRTADMMGEGIKEIWALYKNPNVSEIDKIVLASTFDHVIVLKEHLPHLIKAFREFEGETSLKEQAEAIEEALNNDQNLIAIAWNQTSVNCGVWNSEETTIEDDEETHLPYNMLSGNKHWNLFAE